MFKYPNTQANKSKSSLGNECCWMKTYHQSKILHVVRTLSLT